MPRRKLLARLLPCSLALHCVLLGACDTTPSVDDNTVGRVTSGATGQPTRKIKRPKTPQPAPPTDKIPDLTTPLELTDQEWRERLTPAQFEIMRADGTEPPYTGTYLKESRAGIYHCAACNNPLFDSSTKFDSRTGWPSFYDVVGEAHVTTEPDPRFDLKRTEVSCAYCDAHLGHVFDDGPAPTNLRYCVNSTSLYFRPTK